MKAFVLRVSACVAFSVFQPLTAQTTVYYDDGSTDYEISGYTEDYGSTNVTVGYLYPANRLYISEQGVLKNEVGRIGHSSSTWDNLVSVSGTGSAWQNNSVLYVGYVGSNNSLLIQNGGIVTSTWGPIGYNSASTENYVTVEGAGSAWTNTYLQAGVSGDNNAVIVTNGGRIVSLSSTSTIGQESPARYNSVTLTGTNSVWNNAGTTRVGGYGDYNRLIVSEGAALYSNSGSLGGYAAAARNRAIITGAGSVWSNATVFTVGSYGDYNSLIVSNGAAVFCVRATIGSEIGAVGNTATVTGSNSIWDIEHGTSGDIYVGSYGRNSKLYILDGGTVHTDYGWIGRFSTGSNSFARVSGAGSLWENDHDVYVGSGADQCELRIQSGGTVENMTGVAGRYPASSVNKVWVQDNGSLWDNRQALYIGLQGHENSLFIENGGRVECLEAGIGGFSGADDNEVVVSGSNTIWNIDTDLTVGLSGNSGNSLLITNLGTVAADTLSVAAGSTVTLRSGGSLTTSNEFTMSAGATLEVGIGSASASGYGTLTANGPATLGGTLDVGLDNSYVPAAGSSFDLFDWNGAPSGDFASIALPALSFGLGWNTNNITSTGKLEVEALDTDGDGLTDIDEVNTYGTSPNDPDSDDDGFDDFFEVSNEFSPTNSHAVMVDYIETHEDIFGLYTSNSIMDLAMGTMMVQATPSNMVYLWLQLEQCTNLVEGVWTNAGDAVLWTHPALEGKSFFRVRSSP